MGWALINRGNVYHQQGNRDAAIADWIRASAMASDNNCRACAFYNLGNLYFEEGDLDQAIVYFTQAIEAYPNYRAAYLNRAQAYKAKGNNEAAAADLKQASELTGATSPTGSQ
jgi:tetratricopeptide (TPR) repeat protein